MIQIFRVKARIKTMVSISPYTLTRNYFVPLELDYVLNSYFVEMRLQHFTIPKKPLTRVSKRVPGAHGKRGLERGWQKRLAKGWRKVDEGLAKGWHRVGEGLAKG